DDRSAVWLQEASLLIHQTGNLRGNGGGGQQAGRGGCNAQDPHSTRHLGLYSFRQPPGYPPGKSEAPASPEAPPLATPHPGAAGLFTSTRAGSPMEVGSRAASAPESAGSKPPLPR